MSRRHSRPGSVIAVAAAALLVSACGSISPDRGFASVSALATERLGFDARMVRTDADAEALAKMIDDKLRQPLQVGDAVQIALLNNRALQSTYWSAGIAEADLVQAGRLQNPSFSFERTRQGSDIDIERSLTMSLVGALTAPLARRIEERGLQQTRLMVANDMLAHAAETQRAYLEAVTAQQAMTYARRVSDAADASAELSGRMARAGNASQLDLARERAFRAEATAGVGRAHKRVIAAREKLSRLMGLWGGAAAYQLPERLPDLPAEPAELEDIERVALRDRLDIQAARIEAAQTAASLGLTKTTRFINVLDLGYVRNTSGGVSAPGYAITLELPLFDWGSARAAKSEAIYVQGVNKVAHARWKRAARRAKPTSTTAPRTTWQNITATK
ncbi:TolC family protein [Massilia eurypsychrophila]|uniref:TolC family protein n=1 Tax=Massilia eurypsychrophila TaxID=1485217 RepID=UPI001E433B35|nr:TolC family protein [Massilia eurypsychrophila]